MEPEKCDNCDEETAYKSTLIVHDGSDTHIDGVYCSSCGMFDGIRE